MRRHGEVAEEDHEPLEVATDVQKVLHRAYDAESACLLQFHQSQKLDQLEHLRDPPDSGVTRKTFEVL